MVGIPVKFHKGSVWSKSLPSPHTLGVVKVCGVVLVIKYKVKVITMYTTLGNCILLAYYLYKV